MKLLTKYVITIYGKTLPALMQSQIPNMKYVFKETQDTHIQYVTNGTLGMNLWTSITRARPLVGVKNVTFHL